MQPQSVVPADLDNIPVAWFDTGTRVWREELLRGAEIAFAGTALPKEPGPAARRAVPAGLALGLLAGAALLFPGLGLRGSGALARVQHRAAFWRGALALGLAEARRNPARAGRALLAMLRSRGVDPARSAALRRLDSGLFAPQGRADASLTGLARQALREFGRESRRATP